MTDIDIDIYPVLEMIEKQTEVISKLSSNAEYDYNIIELFRAKMESVKWNLRYIKYLCKIGKQAQLGDEYIKNTLLPEVDQLKSDIIMSRFQFSNLEDNLKSTVSQYNGYEFFLYFLRAHLEPYHIALIHIWKKLDAEARPEVEEIKQEK